MRNIALEYIGVGWFLTQVVAVMARQFGWPSQVGDYLVIVLGVGFVATLGAALLVRARLPFPGSGRRKGLLLAGVAAGAALGVWVLRGGPAGVQAGPAGFVNESRGLFSASSEIEGFFVVHPQEPLIPTGVFVNRGQTITAWGDGRINIALARLVESVDAGDAVAYEWVGPEGEVDARGQPILRQDRARAGRQECLVNRAFPYGALMLLIAPTDRITPTTARGLEPDTEIFVVGSRVETRARVSGYLTLGVNDVYLDREECDPEEFAAGRQAGAFYRDNIGFFSVRLRVR